MKKNLRILAAIVVLGSVGFWAATGANRGWTKTSVAKRTLDETTGIEGITYEKKFVPGLEFLGSALFGAGVLAGISLFARSKQTEPQTEPTPKS
jgi:hypothetical protein